MKKNFRAAFTLTEMLIVIGIIIMLALIAVPAFKTMTGSKSVEAASNQLSALLGRARSEAIGLQQVTGVLFFIDPSTERVNAAMVSEVQLPASDPTFVFLDTVPNRDMIALPPGILLQTIDSAALSGNVRQDNGFIGFNGIAPNNSPVTDLFLPAAQSGGVVLFDRSGRLISKKFAFVLRDPTNNQPTGLALLMWGDATPPAVTTAGYQSSLFSGFGFVLFERESFVNSQAPFGNPFSMSDNFPESASSYTTGSPSERDEEKWLDENAVPYLINRYSGTLIKGE